MSLASRYRGTITGVQSMTGIWAQDASGPQITTFFTYKAALKISIVLKYN